MNKNTKKKVLSLALVIALLAIAVVGGSLAWFSDTDEATNTFTVGSVVIEQLEQQPVFDNDGNPTGDYEDFAQNKVLLPIVNTADPSADPNYQYKMVSVKNNGDNAAYVRTFIAVPAALANDYLKLDIVADGWVQQFYAPQFTDDKNVTYVVYCYVHNDALKPGDTDNTTGLLLKGVYLDSSVDIKDNPADNDSNLEFCRMVDGKYTFSGFDIADATGKILSSLDILVLTEAVQAEGFKDAQGALNDAFGKIDGGAYNPFTKTAP